MSAGIIPTKADVDYQAGNLARDLNTTLDKIRQFKAWLDQYTSQQMVDNGWCTATTDADNIKSAFGDLDQLRTIYEGSATLAVAKDFRAFAERLFAWGY